jgi:hypothetical protein
VCEKPNKGNALEGEVDDKGDQLRDEVMSAAVRLRNAVCDLHY